MRRAGFSLLELILVLLVLTLLTGIILPRFSGALPGAKLGKASSDVHTVIQKVRADAAILVKRYQLFLDPTAGTYWVQVELDPLGKPGIFTFPSGPLRHVFELPEDVDFSQIVGAEPAANGSGQVFTFYPDGTVEPGQIILTVVDGPSQTLVLDGATSDVEVLE